MASETTFDHWKVVFLMRKSVKNALTFEAHSSRFQDLHFWNPRAICDNLALTKKMGVFFRLRTPSGPMCTDFFGTGFKEHPLFFKYGFIKFF